MIASHLIDYNFIQWVSSEYREAQRSAVESLAILHDQVEENPYLSTAYWLSQFILPWSLLFLGEWGEMLREIEAGVTMADKNGQARGCGFQCPVRSTLRRTPARSLLLHADIACVPGLATSPCNGFCRCREDL